MTQLRTSCPDCNDILLEPENIIKLTQDRVGNSHSFSFICPKCNTKQNKAITMEKINVLKTLGVLEYFIQPPITSAEINSFARKLNTEDIIDMVEKENY